MKLFFFITLLCFSSVSYSSTEVAFPEEGAVLVIQGQDSDAGNLYKAMNVPAVLENGIHQKQINVINDSAQEVLIVICKKLYGAENTACTIDIKTGYINKKDRHILVGMNGRYEAPSTGKKFHHQSNDKFRGEIFVSENKKVHFWKTFDSSGSVASVTLEYRD